MSCFGQLDTKTHVLYDNINRYNLLSNYYEPGTSYILCLILTALQGWYLYPLFYRWGNTESVKLRKVLVFPVYPGLWWASWTYRFPAEDANDEIKKTVQLIEPVPEAWEFCALLSMRLLLEYSRRKGFDSSFQGGHWKNGVYQEKSGQDSQESVHQVV